MWSQQLLSHCHLRLTKIVLERLGMSALLLHLDPSHPGRHQTVIIRCIKGNTFETHRGLFIGSYEDMLKKENGTMQNEKID